MYPSMFSPMSSGRDNWDEAGSSGDAKTQNQTMPSTLISLKVDPKGKGKEKGKLRSALTPVGRVLAPTSAAKMPLLSKKKAGERRIRRNHYATQSIDEGLGERQALLGSPSSQTFSQRSKSRAKRSKPPLWKDAFRPSKSTVDRWMESWTARWTVLAVIPSAFVSGQS